MTPELDLGYFTFGTFQCPQCGEVKPNDEETHTGRCADCDERARRETVARRGEYEIPDDEELGAYGFNIGGKRGA